MFERILNKIARSMDLERACGVTAMRGEVAKLREAIGHSESRFVRSSACAGLREAEFSVYSQFGEDGIIQYLIARVPIERRAFVEVGVEAYTECNTRFLLVHDNWEGLVLNGGSEHIRTIANSDLGWRHTVTAESAFIDRDNIDELVRRNGFAGDIGLFSLDIDGNDYWVWERLSVCSPRIFVAEYNSIFGPDLKIAVPYRADFERTKAHRSNLFWGSSLAALCELADRKGYVFAGSNLHGNNAFFVRKDVAAKIRSETAADGWQKSMFRESRDAAGKLTYLSEHADRLQAIRDCEVFDLETQSVVRIAKLFEI